MLKEYRAELEKHFQGQLRQQRDFFNQCFHEIGVAIQAGSVDAYVQATNKLTENLGGKVLFRNKEEFDRLMKSDDPIVL